ncbi:DUF4214 domain-containing protein [Pseudomonas yangonensis]|uniref:DUF4214 domain-containing protein n=1 Tax=Pseudomonas yangonensis TaxID=2579922 RepID=UPI00137B026C|nr:DUF4214 domain-containing protein [Pseudomonas yangonensis]
MATVSDLQQLYIGYFGRAADQAGLNFWLGAINNDGLSLANVHAAFVNSDEYNAQYEGLTVSQKVAAVYENVLGRVADTEGAAFWTKAIEDGTITEDQLIEALLSGLSTKDAQAISNKIVVANYYTSAKGDAYNEASKAESGAIIKTVTDKLSTVGDALTEVGKVVGVSNAELASALKALEAAEKAQVEVAKAFLGDAAEGLTDTQILAAADGANGINAKFGAALTAAQNAATAVDAGVTLAGDAGDAAKLKIALDKAAADVSASRAEVAKTAGLPDLVTKFNTQLAAQKAAAATLAAAQGEQAAEKVKAEAIIGETLTIDGTTGVTVDANGVKVFSIVNNQLVIDKEFSDANADATVPAQVANLKAANDLLADVKATLAATKAQSTADAAVDATGAQIDAASNDSYDAGTNTISGGVVADLLADIAEQEALVKAAQAYSKAGTVAAEYKAAGDAITAAEKAITDAAGLDYDLVDLTNANAGTAAKEVFVFGEATTALDLAVTKGDVLYVGSNYKLGTAEYDATNPTKIVGGDNSALEVFFIQNGADVDVVIEKSVFGSSAATPEVATITLTGTTVDKLSFDAQNGFVNFEVA